MRNPLREADSEQFGDRRGQAAPTFPMLQLPHAWLTPWGCGYSESKAASGSREQHKPSQGGNATRAAAHIRGLQYAKQQESLQSPELLCAPADFRTHFLMPRGPPWPRSHRHPAPPATHIKNHQSRWEHGAPFPEPTPRSAVLCSAAQVSTGIKSRPRAGELSPELPQVTPGTVTTSKQRAGSERCNLLFIACIHSRSQRLPSHPQLLTCQHLPGTSPRALGTPHSTVGARLVFACSVSLRCTSEVRIQVSRLKHHWWPRATGSPRSHLAPEAKAAKLPDTAPGLPEPPDTRTGSGDASDPHEARGSKAQEAGFRKPLRLV